MKSLLSVLAITGLMTSTVLPSFADDPVVKDVARPVDSMMVHPGEKDKMSHPTKKDKMVHPVKKDKMAHPGEKDKMDHPTDKDKM
jgi:hypothetical protein